MSDKKRKCRHCGAENDPHNGECWQCKKPMSAEWSQTVGVLFLIIPACIIGYWFMTRAGC